MNVAGPSRAGPGPSSRARGSVVESTYEADLRRLLNQLDLDEMDEMQTFFTQRTRAGDPLSDHDVAMNDLLVQARALAIFDQDRALAQRIAGGEDSDDNDNDNDNDNDSNSNDEDEEDEEQTPTATPRLSFENMNEHARTATPPNPTGNQQQHVEQPSVSNDATDSHSWGGWLSSVVGWVLGVPSAELGSSTAAQKRPSRPTGHNCIICQDPIYGAEIYAPCGHYYGIDCVTNLFQSATKDETLFPPRCCRQNIPFAQVQPHLSQALITTFQGKQVEFGTLKRVYCSSPTCSHFLGPVTEGVFGRVYTCPAPGCGRHTCGKCRERHSGDWTHTCRPDADATQVLDLGRASGWARCPGCSQLIELNIGCFHMTCRCRTEFCYLCRARWKTCGCPQWDERRLMAAAEERVDARLGIQRPAPAPAPVPVIRVAPRPPAPVPAPVPEQRPVLARPMGIVQRVEPRAPPAPPAPPPAPVPARPIPPVRTTTAAASSSTARTASASTTGATTTQSVGWRSRFTGASTTPATGAPASEPTLWRPRRASALASGSRSTAASSPSPSLASSPESPWASTSASASASASASTWRPTWTPKPSTTTTTTTANSNRQRLVREMMDRLRYDHECEHEGWRYRNGGGTCQNCGHRLPLYLFRCRGCDMLACNRCRRNRL